MADAPSAGRRALLELLVLGALAHPRTAYASYPARPVLLVVPGGAGGATDAIARIIEPHAEGVLGRPLVIENRNGAGGLIGTMEVVRARADGYTLLVASMGTHVLMPLLVESTPFDTLRDLAPITRLVDVPGIILAAPDLPVRDLHDVIALARKAKRPLSYGTPGIGTSAHLIAEMLRARTGIDLLHVPYSSSPPSYADLMAGRLALAFSLVSGVRGHVLAGRMKAIAVTGAKRVRALPDVPTVQESGLADFDVTSWYGLMAPSGTPDAVLERDHRAFAQTLGADDVEKRLEGIGAEPVGDTPAAFAARIRDDYRRWAEVIRSAGIHL